MIRAIVAELPLHRPHRPSFWYVFVKNKMVARNEYGISLLFVLETKEIRLKCVCYCFFFDKFWNTTTRYCI